MLPFPLALYFNFFCRYEYRLSPFSWGITREVEAGDLLARGDTQGLTQVLQAMAPENTTSWATGSLRKMLQRAAPHDTAKVALLLEHGAAPNMPDKSGNYILVAVILSGDTDSAALLLEHGANPNIPIRDDEMSPLGIAVTTDRNEIARLLVQHGADVHAANFQGNTPLHFAARRGNLAAVEMLLEAGADINACNDAGQTPLAIAAKPAFWPSSMLVNAGRRKVAEYLRMRQA